MSDGQWAPNSLVFVPDATDAFVPRTVVSCRGFGAEAQLVVAEKAGGSGVTVPKDAVGGVVEVDPMSLQGADDMVKFSNLNEAALLHNLRVRYGRDDIYSAAGSILISINPFKTVPIYTEDRMRMCKVRADRRCISRCSAFASARTTHLSFLPTCDVFVPCERVLSFVHSHAIHFRRASARSPSFALHDLVSSVPA